MSMLRTLADRGDRRPLHLVYASRDWENVIFRDEIQELQTRLDLRVTHVLQYPPEDWEGASGFVTLELLKQSLPEKLGEYQYYICGPEPMMNAVEINLSKLGVPLTNFHSERFNLV